MNVQERLRLNFEFFEKTGIFAYILVYLDITECWQRGGTLVYLLNSFYSSSLPPPEFLIRFQLSSLRARILVAFAQ